MKKKSVVLGMGIWSMILIASFLLVSCGGKQTQTSEPEPAVAAEIDPPLAKSFKTIIVHEMTAATPELQEETKVMDECFDAVLADLRANPRFSVIDGRTAGQSTISNGLDLKITLTGIRVVSKKARFWGGALAGSSYMNVDLTFVDTASAKKLRQKEISSANNPFGAAWTGGSSDNSLASDVGQIIAAYVDAVVPQ